MGDYTIQEMPASERPREKLAQLGARALTDAELLAILLRVGTRGKNAIELGRELIHTYGSLTGLARASVAELKRIKGVGLAKAVQLAAAIGLGERLAREMVANERLDRPERIYQLLGAEMRALDRESLRAVLLDTQHHLIRVAEISLGSLNESLAHPREVFRPAILHAAFAFVLVHNHPSGDPTPSEADRRLTRRLIEVASLLQIRFIDHVIVGAPGDGRLPYFSFLEAGMMQ